MMNLTHAAIALAGVTFALGDISPSVLGLTVVGSQLPDLDTSNSTIGRICFPLARFIEARFPHRTITHCLLATGALAVVSLPLLYCLGVKPWSALWCAHLISCFADTFTKQGVQLFFPHPVWCVSGLNPKRRLTTGSPAEYWVLASGIALFLLNIKLIHAGGILQATSQQLGLKSGLIDVYNRHAATHLVYAEVEGRLAIDSSEANGKYFIIGVEGGDFIVQQGENIFKTGTQLIAQRIATSTGEVAKTTISALSFDDEDAISRLTQLSSLYPHAAIYLSGTLAVDFPEDVRITPEPEEYPVIELSGSNLSLSWCPLEEAIVCLRDQYASGTLTAKIITPRPKR